MLLRRKFEGLRVPRGEDGVHGGGVHQVGVFVPDEVGHVVQIIQKELRRKFEGLRVPRGEDGVSGGGVHRVGVVVPDEVGHVAQIIQKDYKK